MNKKMHLVFLSEATFSVAEGRSEIESDLLHIMSYSRRANANHGITGVLYYGKGYFLNCLEGAEVAIKRVMESMRLDPRHKNLEILTLKSVEQSVFSTWRMRFARTDEAVKQVLAEFNMPSFEPYQFTPALIQALLMLSYDEYYERCA
jgi:hypothetical protein